MVEVFNERISTGTEVFDELLNGGYEKDTVTTVYGPAGAGKSNLCVISALSVARQSKKVLFIDTEGGFSIERASQIDPEYKELMRNIIFMKPTSFQGQEKAFQKLKEMNKSNIGLIIVDTIAMLYRLELGKSEDVYSINKSLGLQLAYLSEVARRDKIPVLITNQVYSNFDDRGSVNMVGGDILKYGSKCLIEIQKFHKRRRAILKKHRSLPEGKEIIFEINEHGFRKVDSLL